MKVQLIRLAVPVLLVLAIASCAQAETGPERQPQQASPAPTAGQSSPSAEPDERFATLPADSWTTVPGAALKRATFLLEGQCTIGEMPTGDRVFLIWPDGHVEFDEDAAAVRFTNVTDGAVAEFSSGQVLDLRVTPGSSDRGSHALDASDFVVPPDPSCPDEDVAIVTGVSIE